MKHEAPRATSLTWKINKHISTQLWLYHNVEKREKYIFFLSFKCSLFLKTWVLFTHGCFVASLIKIGPVVLEKLNKYNFAILLLSRLGLERGPSSEEIEYPSSKFG